MRNIKLTIEYDGTNYHGWQIQPNAITIQAAIQDALTKITKTQTSNHWGREDGHRGTCRRSGCQFPHPFPDAADLVPESTQRYLATRHRRYKCRRGLARFPRPVQCSESVLSVHDSQSCIPFRAPAEQYLFFFPNQLRCEMQTQPVNHSSASGLFPLFNAPAVSESTQSVRFTNVDVGRTRIWSILRLKRMPFYGVWFAPLSAPS